MSRKPLWILSLGALALALLFAGAAAHHAAPQAAAATAAAQPAQKLALPGVPNLGRVADSLYRGGQPNPEGFAHLKKLGIAIVVNLRDGRAEIETERGEVETLGLRYVSIPWSALHAPTDAQLAEFLNLLRANPQTKVFVHCHHGSDRTGVMVAAYRIAEQHWTPAAAVKEMEAFHYHHFWLPHLQRYVENLPSRFADTPSLRALLPAARSSTP